VTCPRFQCRFLPVINFLAAQFSRPKFTSPAAHLPGFLSVSRLIFGSVFFSFRHRFWPRCAAPLCPATIQRPVTSYSIFPSASRVKSPARFWPYARHGFIWFSAQVLRFSLSAETGYAQAGFGSDLGSTARFGLRSASISCVARVQFCHFICVHQMLDEMFVRQYQSSI
jgi:hypothetical protein